MLHKYRHIPFNYKISHSTFFYFRPKYIKSPYQSKADKEIFSYIKVCVLLLHLA